MLRTIQRNSLLSFIVSDCIVFVFSFRRHDDSDYDEPSPNTLKRGRGRGRGSGSKRGRGAGRGGSGSRPRATATFIEGQEGSLFEIVKTGRTALSVGRISFYTLLKELYSSISTVVIL